MATVVRKKDESVESLIKRFKRKVQDEGIIQELRKREYYLSKAQKARKKSAQARARAMKRNNVLVSNNNYD